MNIKTNSKLRNFLCSVIAVFAFTMSNLLFLHFNKQTYTSYASSNASNSISIDNANFTNDSDNIFPIKTISGFTAYSNNQEATNTNPNCGVIDLSDDAYSTRFAIAKEGRASLDNYVLMLTSNSTGINFGYRTKNEISMNANSNYMLTVDVFTEDNAGVANLSLYNDGETFTQIDKINSSGQWITYHLFVKTGEDSLSLKLGLNITNKGTALFDNIACYEISNTELEQQISYQHNANIDYAYSNNVDASHIVTTYTVVDNMFANSDGTKTILNTNFEENKNDTDYTEISTIDDTDGTNSKALKINNKQKTFVEYTANNMFEFEQGYIYKVSVNAKTKNLSGSASLKLTQADVDSDDAKDSDAITISTNSSSSVNNNYQTYTFYVKADPTKATSYNLVFSLGSSDSSAQGELYISQVEVKKIKTSNIPSSLTDAVSLDLTSDYALSSNSIYVNNGKFDSFTIEDIDNPFPATPSNWTVTKGNGTQAYGVVNTKNANYTSLSNKLFYPYTSEKNENVLMMYNANSDTLVYTSESKSLNANSYHKFTIDVQSQISAIKISIIAKKDGKEFELASKSILTNAQNWQTLTFYLKTGSQPIDAYVKATLTSTNEACAFIDNVTFDYPIANENGYNNASNSNICAKVDLTDIISTNFFTEESNTSGNFEIVNLNDGNYTSLVGADNVENFSKYAGENKNLIKLQNIDDTDFYITSNLAYKLTSGNKYKLSIDAFSVGLRTEVSDADLEKLGFGISLSNFENEFTAKQSNGVWTTYTIYINCSTDSTSYLTLSLGNSDLLASGTVYFGNIQFVELEDDEEFNSVVESDNTIILKNAETETSDDETSDNETTTEKSGIDKQTLLYVIPTIAFAVAIIVTIIVVFARKVKWKKPSRKTKNAYDRNKTVSKQYYERKATMIREEKLRELNKQLESLNNDRLTYEEEYKKDISSLRKLKISRASSAEISKLEKEMKKNQRNSSNIGVTISKIKREIEYMQTDLYYNSLVKKLSIYGVDEDDKVEEN